MAKAIFAGSFDPFTLGHLDIVHEASEMFDEVWIVIASNDSKSGRVYDAEKMATAIEETCRRADLKNCYATVLPSYMSIIEYAERNEIKFLVRGVRDADDFAYESKMADINKEFNARIRTVFMLIIIFPLPLSVCVKSLGALMRISFLSLYVVGLDINFPLDFFKNLCYNIYVR